VTPTMMRNVDAMLAKRNLTRKAAVGSHLDAPGTTPG
jgi:hypothetical protein